MLWFFERGAELLRIETTHDRINGVFVLRAHRPDGTEHVEQFASDVACRQRLAVLERELRTEQWVLRRAQPLDRAR